MNWVALIACLGLCFGVGALGGRWTAPEIGGWYTTLKRPSFAPPNGIFGPVWTLLYALMGTAAWLIWISSTSGARNLALGLFVGQLVLNLAWSWFFFRKHSLGGALLDVFLLWMAVGVTTIAFGQIAPRAGLLMAPYWAWVTFAAVLNAAFLRLNPGAKN
jgi:tryptophan-rich sensory protein